MTKIELQVILDKRNKAHADAKEIHALAIKEDRDLTSDEQSQFDKAYLDMERYDKQLKTEERLARVEAESDMRSGGIAFGGGNPGGDANGGTPNAEKRTKDAIERDYQKVFTEHYFRSRRSVIEDTDLEPHMPKELRVAQKVGTDNIGGYLVPEEWANRIVKIMSYYGPMMEAGNVFNTTTGADLHIPTEDTTAQKGFIIDEDVPDSEMLVNWGTMKYGAFMYSSGIIPIAFELLQDNDYDVEGRVIMAAGERIGRITNDHLTNGNGTTQPQGIMTGSTNSGLTIVSNTLTVDALIDLEHSIDRAYRQGPKVGWMFSDGTIAELKKLSLGNTTAGYPLWVPSLKVGEPDTILGYKYWVNNEMDNMSGAGKKPVLFGDFSKYGIRQVRGISLRRTTERYWERRVIAYNAIARYDAKVEDANALKYLTVSAFS